MNDDEEGINKGDPDEEGYQGPPDSPEIDEIIDNSDEERAANYYDQYIGAKVVLPDRKGDKLMGKVRKHVRYDEKVQARVIIMTCMTSIYINFNILMERRSNWQII